MKQAQLTVHIIIGVLALLFIGLGIYVVNKTIVQQISSPPQTTITTYITDCLQNTAKEALQLIGEQGGYSNPLRQGMTPSSKAAEGDVLMLSEQPVPYWWHLQGENTCTSCDLSSKQMPSLEFIAKQVKEYVENNLQKCASFDEFAQQGAHVSAGNITANVEFTQDNTKIYLNWPITITQTAAETKKESFETTIDVPLKKIYNTASEITLEEKNNATLEKMLLHIIGLYSDTSPAKLPPFSAVTHDNGAVSWNKNIVEQQLSTVLTSTVPIISYGKPITKKEKTFEEAALSALRFGKDTNFDVKFHYLGWPFYFDITPKEKDMLKPEIVRTKFPNNAAPPFQTNTYEFFYDISLPLLVEIRHAQANKGEGYSFFFALETNIRDNKELKEFFTGEGTYGPFDSTNTTTVQKLQRKTANHTLFCDEEQKLSGTIKINVLDGRNNTPIPDAALSYGCGKISTCMLPTTNHHGSLKTKLPICYNGHLRAEKEEYSPAVHAYTSDFEKHDEINITLQPLREVNIAVKKYNTNGTAITSGPRSLQTNEQAIIILERAKESIEEQFQTQTRIKGTDTQTISLIPGTYEARIILIDETGYVLPAKCMQICEAYNKEGKCSTFKQLPEKPQKVKPAIIGGAVLNTNTELFEITDYTLDKRGINTIEFYVVKTQTPNCITKENCIFQNCIGIDEIGRTEEYSKKFIKELKPRFFKR
ncbi:MAG: hypothetical protein HY363_02290 [Candidatus Aenigmarchaeota archaeon]|nr:hypothetical protein [Candidatus Aenigmarchaeota archaeon]